MGDDVPRRRAADTPGWGDNLERILRILFLGAFVLILGFGLLWGMMNDREIPEAIKVLGPVALGFLAAERPQQTGR